MALLFHIYDVEEDGKLHKERLIIKYKHSVEATIETIGISYRASFDSTTYKSFLL